MLFGNIYDGKKIFLTGHTGFKGSWLKLWLETMGAKVLGYSLDIPTDPSHHKLLNSGDDGILQDIRDLDKLSSALKEYEPDLIIHMAAQPLVRKSYKEPVDTFASNVMGTVNVLEASRYLKNLKGIVNITTDKCYENREWVWGYRENDPMGGHDPYSASKGCAELVTSAFRNSYYNTENFGKEHNIIVTSVRAGNVIGGGDWAEDRLIPDIMKSIKNEETVVIRSPGSTRPWQHVLEPLSGYLLLGQKILEGKVEFSGAWNFGPEDEGTITVKKVVESIKSIWPKLNYDLNKEALDLHEANLLKLDCSKAYQKLKWKAVWNSEQTFTKTTEWYKAYYEDNKVITQDQIDEYIASAKEKELVWIS